MKTSDLEKRLKKHAKITKSLIAPPFKIKGENREMTPKKHRIKRTLILAAVLIFVLSGSVFAAFRFMSAKEVADTLGDSKLARYFTQQGNVLDTVTDGAYKATVLGITSGENLSDFQSSSWELFPERTYVVVAIEKTDNSDMTFDDEILATPLIEGLSPWQYNIFTMNGGYSADIIDGILYRIIEFDNIEYFADRPVYMAILSEPFLNNTAYAFDETTGKITPKSDYNGTNMLIPLTLDPAKADPQKAAEYLSKLNEPDTSDEDTTVNEETNSDEEVEIVITQEMLEEALTPIESILKS